MAVAEKRDLYEVLGVDRQCTADEIRSAYKKLALQRHPDKLVQSGISQADATAQFQELVNAYEILSDPKERAWYDTHRSQVLFADANSSSSSPIIDLSPYFSNSAFSGYSDSAKGFFKVYSDVFSKVYSAELNYARKMGLGIDSVRETPLMGNLDSPYSQVTAFYNYWLGFCTVMDFGWVDMYDSASGESRRLRRLMEEENKKVRKKARKEYNDMVRSLAEFVKKRDKRVIDMTVKRNLENEKMKEEMRKKKMEKEKLDRERAAAYKEQEWAAVEEEEFEDEDDLFGDGDGEVQKEEFYCVACGKKFKSQKQWENHEKSKKHKEKVAALREHFIEEDEALDGEIHEGVLEEDVVEDIEKRMRDELEINSETELGEERERLFDVDDDNNDAEEEVKKNVGVDGEDRGADEIRAKEKVREDAGHSGGIGVGDDDVDDISILEAMLSGRKNHRKAAAFMQEELKGNLGDSNSMEYDNRKSSKKNRSRRKEKGKKNDGEAEDGNRVGNDGDELVDSVAKTEAKSAVEVDEIVEKQKREKSNAKKDTNTKSKNLPKGKKGKSSSKNLENLCETCGEEFESRNKLHKHLGETGHASLKYKR